MKQIWFVPWLLGMLLVYFGCGEAGQDGAEPDAALMDAGDVDTTFDTDTILRTCPGMPQGWEKFCAGCRTDTDCTGYPGERRCLQDVLQMINVPRGYCSACCNEPGPDICGPGIDCVGAYGVYLVCLAHCVTDADCRREDGYVCREIYFVPDEFPGTYCLPTPDLVEPDPEKLQELSCPWPWL